MCGTSEESVLGAHSAVLEGSTVVDITASFTERGAFFDSGVREPMADYSAGYVVSWLGFRADHGG